jgi:hypothetical protein
MVCAACAVSLTYFVLGRAAELGEKRPFLDAARGSAALAGRARVRPRNPETGPGSRQQTSQLRLSGRLYAERDHHQPRIQKSAIGPLNPSRRTRPRRALLALVVKELAKRPLTHPSLASATPRARLVGSRYDRGIGAVPPDVAIQSFEVTSLPPRRARGSEDLRAHVATDLLSLRSPSLLEHR